MIYKEVLVNQLAQSKDQCPCSQGLMRNLIIKESKPKVIGPGTEVDIDLGAIHALPPPLSPLPNFVFNTNFNNFIL